MVRRLSAWSMENRKRLMALLAPFVLTGCPEDNPKPKPEPEPGSIVRWWSFTKLMASGAAVPMGDERVKVGGVVDESVDLGPLLLFPPEVDPRASAQVFASENGKTYWVAAQAPRGRVSQRSEAIGSSTELTQLQFFKKTSEDAALRIVVSKAFLDAIDSNGGLPTATECPWRAGDSIQTCRRVMDTWVAFDVEAFSFADQKVLLRTGGTASLNGWTADFGREVHNHANATRRFWSRDSFEFDPDVTATGGTRAQLYLHSDIAIDIPLGSVGVGGEFSLQVTATAGTLNLRQRESYLSAFFRDPQDQRGLSFSYHGVQPIKTPVEKPTLRPAEPAPPCDGAPDPAAGVIEFSHATFADPELPGRGALVTVTRAGGSRGAVSALFTTSDGTAVGGTDYEAVESHVLFADGEEGSRAVHVPISTDEDAEPDKTVELTLSAPNGCAALGSQTRALLTILDDDRDVTAPTYTVGGTVTGLTGTGLVLREVMTGFELTPGDGPFAFAYAFPDGGSYEVRVAAQPTQPTQVCRVSNPSGAIAGANVTNVAVDCATAQPNGALDPTFGDAGRVSEGMPGGGEAIALQTDGKIVVAGARSLARYTADGKLDTSFGSGGVVTPVFQGSLSDEAHGVAIQADGRIVVVGSARVGTQDDFAVMRYESNGTPDGSFGSAGKVTTDFSGAVDRAYAVRVQPDGKIVVAGHKAANTPLGVENDFAVVRYTSSGALDSSFGTGGKVTTDIGGQVDLAYAAVLQSDGKLVVGGRVAADGGDDPDVGLVRYTASGTPDPSFGAGGIVRQNLASWDEAADLAVQADGKLVVAVQALVDTKFQFALARFDSAGGFDSGFGAGGLATTAFSDQHDYARALALAPDGKIVVVGQSSNLLAPDFAIARFDARGALDAGFGNGGKLTLDFFGSSDSAECVVIQRDGKVVVGGLARNGTATGLGLARLVP